MVVAIVGILATIVLLNIGGFMGTGEVEAANTEYHSLRTAISKIIMEAGGGDVTAASGLIDGSSITVGGTAYALNDYVTGSIKGTYSIDAASVFTGTSYPGDIEWDDTKWVKAE